MKKWIKIHFSYSLEDCIVEHLVYLLATLNIYPSLYRWMHLRLDGGGKKGWPEATKHVAEEAQLFQRAEQLMLQFEQTPPGLSNSCVTMHNSQLFQQLL